MEMEQLYGGIDTHKETFTGCILDEEGSALIAHRIDYATNLNI
jgi:hypothetical protein